MAWCFAGSNGAPVDMLAAWLAEAVSPAGVLSFGLDVAVAAPAVEAGVLLVAGVALAVALVAAVGAESLSVVVFESSVFLGSVFGAVDADPDDVVDVLAPDAELACAVDVEGVAAGSRAAAAAGVAADGFVGACEVVDAAPLAVDVDDIMNARSGCEFEVLQME
jgi:hypothetical protein